MGVVLALLWAAAIVALFFHGQIEFADFGRQGGPRLVGLWSVFGALGKGFSPGAAPFPFWPLVGGAAALWLFALTGRLFLLCFEIYVPPSARRALALLCGMAITGILLEPLAIFGWLTASAVWAVLLATVLVLWRVSYKRQRRLPEGSIVNGDARVFRRAMREEARQRYEQSLIRPRGLAARAFACAAVALIAAITLLTFYHALLYPESYWDSLILYLGYARTTFLQHKFPVKVVAQVGIGLGANYPHWFALLGAATAAMWGHWSPLYQQLMTPVLGLATTVLVYHAALGLTRRVNGALAAALLFRAIPYGIAYDVWASDYALAMALSAGFCYLALLYIESGKWGYLACLTLLTAAGTHLNYLMWIYWPLWILVVLAAHLFNQAAGAGTARWGAASGEGMTVRAEPEFTAVEPPAPLSRLLRGRRLWITVLVGVALSLPWVARNWIVCGNPFYPFFSGVLDGKNINPEVLQSAFGEWRANGDGIGVVAAQRYGADTLPLRLRATWFYFVPWQSHWPQFWKLAPVFVGFGLPGLAAWLAGLAGAFARRRRTETCEAHSRIPARQEQEKRGLARFSVPGMNAIPSAAHRKSVPVPPILRFSGHVPAQSPLAGIRECAPAGESLPLCLDPAQRFGIVLAGLLLAHLAYFYLLCDFYLYQILAILPAIGILATYWPLGLAGKAARTAFGLLALAVGVMPGVAVALMGPKLADDALTALRHPLMDEGQFYGRVYPGAAEMWEYVNQHLKGQRLLTHENRHLMFDPSIALVHLDDWEVQPLYTVPSPRERADRLKGMGLRYYLRVPMEFKSVINRRLGMDQLLAAGRLKEIYRTTNGAGGDYVLYRIE